jgi:hypothetical protein
MGTKADENYQEKKTGESGKTYYCQAGMIFNFLTLCMFPAISFLNTPSIKPVVSGNRSIG